MHGPLVPSCGILGDNVGNDLVFKLDELVFDDQLLLFHSLNSKLVATNLDHRLYGGIKIQMLLFQSCDCQSNVSLILVGHAVIPGILL